MTEGLARPSCFHLSAPEPFTPILHVPEAKAYSSPHEPPSAYAYGSPEGWDRKGTAALHGRPSLPHPHAGARPRAGLKTHSLPKKREGQAREAGACTEHHPRVGVSGRPIPHLPWQKEEGWLGTGATSNAPEYQGTASPLPRRDAPARRRPYTCVCMRCWKRWP